MPKIVHYREKCIGCAICCEVQPALWRMSRKDGKVTLLKSELKKRTSVLAVSAALAEMTIRAAQACPVKIIKVL
jgi:ferredoxin